MSTNTNPFFGADPFTRFWSDFMAKLASAGIAPPQPAPDILKDIRRTFFDALAEQADQFMRSEAFLGMMKQGVEASLAWQRTMSQFMQKGLNAAQIPSSADADHFVVLLRGMEDRIVERIDDLARRVDNLESKSSDRNPRPVRA
jgi:hypothetical protein